ncbi:hypothetical protein EG830_12570 [bacterium]|nr:hypothetical protein [bacterium]
MYGSTGFLVILLLSLLVFAVSERLKYWFTLVLLVTGIALTTAWSAGILAGSVEAREIPVFTPAGGT